MALWVLSKLPNAIKLSVFLLMLATYMETTAQVVIDLWKVECVVGRVRRGNEWGIIDRSGDFACTVFVDTPIINDEQ